MKRRLLVAGALVAMSTIGVLAQVVHDAATKPDASVWSALLTPQTITTLVVVLLYLGALRQDLQQLKQDVGALKSWRDGLSERLDDRYVPRDLADERHASVMARLDHTGAK